MAQPWIKLEYGNSWSLSVAEAFYRRCLWHIRVRFTSGNKFRRGVQVVYRRDLPELPLRLRVGDLPGVAQREEEQDQRAQPGFQPHPVATDDDVNDNDEKIIPVEAARLRNLN